uniref:Phosphatidic acid phosphatase type 2/haloperoxidase domain-containing protein n=1 Tax=Acrobeloides nanus TaxID=290746 RepID=A0A914CSJ0_9BILA
MGRHLWCAIFSLPATIALRYIALAIPYAKTGFFCNDNEIRYPFRWDTVPSNLMNTLYGIMAFLLIIVSEYSLVKHVTRRNGARLIRETMLHPCVVNCIYFLVIMCTGDLAASAVANLGKRTMSRLRPNFLAVCQPNLTALCPPDSMNFIEDYECLGMFKEDEYFSFPSGHATHSVFFGIFIIVYLQKRCKITEPIKSLIQLVVSMIVFFICMSRVRDYKHRLADVCGGAVIGGVFGIVFVNFVLHTFKPNRYKVEVDEFPEIVDPASKANLLTPTAVLVKPTKIPSDYGSLDESERSSSIVSF